jgi:hypothetical protein
MKMTNAQKCALQRSKKKIESEKNEEVISNLKLEI